MANKITYSKIDRAIVEVLSNATEPLTTNQIGELVGADFKKPHISAAVRKGLIVNCGKIAVPSVAKREVLTYKLVTTDELKDAKEKPFNYTPTEKRILETLVALGDMENITLADIAAAMQVERLTSGNISGLVSKGNVAPLEKITIEVPSTSKVSTYIVAETLPEGFTAVEA